jgi:spore germination cell wall hydrolase CwlJ-like protein
MIDLSKFTDTEILAKTAYGENRSGGNDGMTSVLNVIINRSKKPAWWGKTPREVCLKPWQFDCWNQDDPNFSKIISADDDVYDYAMTLANKALFGELADLTNGSCYYFAKTMNPWPVWARGKQPTADIAGQLFFNNVK